MILKVWDNKGKTCDQYTVRIRNDYFAMSTDANMPNGFNQYIGTYPDIDERRLGKPLTQLSYRSLPKAVRIAIKERT